MTALLNGKWIDPPAGAISPEDRGFRYGAGLFETIRFEGEQAPLWDRHLLRLTLSLSQLGWMLPAHFSSDNLLNDIRRTIRKNQLTGSVRVRLTVTHGAGGLFDGDRKLSFLIEAWPLDPARKEYNSNGWVIGLYEGGRKSADALATIKSTSGLIYAQAAQTAKQQKWNDALVLNTKDEVADSSIANIFLVKGEKLFTTDSNQGAISGVMQSWWIDRLATTHPVSRGPIRVSDLMEAEEVFLTNALFGLRWVGRFGEKFFQNAFSQRLYQTHLRTIFP